MEDTFQQRGQRRNLVEELRRKGIRDQRVLGAVERLPRHWFVEPLFKKRAYEDVPLSIPAGQTISQPFTVARQTELLGVEKRQRVLEIGTGSGYQAAVLALLGARVFTVERQRTLYERTRQFLPRIGFPQVRCYHRDGTEGLPEFAPYDRIVATAGAARVPPDLLDQLAPGGVLVIPVGERQQRMLRVTKLADGTLQQEDFGAYRFVPFLPGRVDER